MSDISEMWKENKMENKNYYTIINTDEFTLIIVRDKDALLEFIRTNDPSEIGYVELDDKDYQEVNKMFNQDPTSNFIGINAIPYDEQLGLGFKK